MDAPGRHALAWIDEAAWRALLARPWDEEARQILTHWQRQELPLVVGRARGAPGDAEGALSLGLPAPLRWSRRRLALTIDPSHVARWGEFPTLRELLREEAFDAALQALASRLGALGVTARVYGSFGWQWLTGERYQRPGSDLDLLLPVADPATAQAVVQALAAVPAPPRLDGELLFPSGDAVAWREFAQALAGLTTQVLAKRRDGVRLVPIDAASGFDPGAGNARPAGATER